MRLRPGCIIKTCFIKSCTFQCVINSLSLEHRDPDVRQREDSDSPPRVFVEMVSCIVEGAAGADGSALVTTVAGVSRGGDWGRGGRGAAERRGACRWLPAGSGRIFILSGGICGSSSAMSRTNACHCVVLITIFHSSDLAIGPDNPPSLVCRSTDANSEPLKSLLCCLLRHCDNRTHVHSQLQKKGANLGWNRHVSADTLGPSVSHQHMPGKYGTK